jgi:hypothetical protein
MRSDSTARRLYTRATNEFWLLIISGSDFRYARPQRLVRFDCAYRCRLSLNDILGQLPRTKSTKKPLYDDQPLKPAHERLARADAVEANYMAVEKHNSIHAVLGAS